MNDFFPQGEPEREKMEGNKEEASNSYPPSPSPNGYDPLKTEHTYRPPQYQIPPNPGNAYYPPYQQPPRGPKMSGGGKAFLIILLSISIILAFCLVFWGMFRQTNGEGGIDESSRGSSSSSHSSMSSGTEASSGGGNFQRPQYSGDIPALELESSEDILFSNELTPKQIAKKVRPSVVGVLAYLMEDGEMVKVGEGSGIILSEDGFIITNAHVIINSEMSYNANDLIISVVTIDNEEYMGVVMGYDTRTDLAVLKVEAQGLQPAEFGDSDTLEVGDYVVAIGNPGGLEYAGSVTHGIVSALNRDVVGVSTNIQLIQVDAAINPGNSGGALVNMYGKVVGINSAKLVSTSYEGMGFSIPITQAKPVIDDLLEYGYVSGRVRIGITCSAISTAQANYENIPQGLLIHQIAEDSPLNGTDAQIGDIITHIDGNQLLTTDDLFDYLEEQKAGDKVTLTIFHAASEENQDITIPLLQDDGQVR